MDTNEQLELLIDTLRRGSSIVLLKNDDELSYDLFEEFDIGAISFLSNENIETLIDAELVTKDFAVLIEKIRQKWFELSERNDDIQTIRTSKEWADFFLMCDSALVAMAARIR